MEDCSENKEASHEDSKAGKEESQTMTNKAHESAKAADANATTALLTLA